MVEVAVESVNSVQPLVELTGESIAQDFFGEAGVTEQSVQRLWQVFSKYAQRGEGNQLFLDIHSFRQLNERKGLCEAHEVADFFRAMDCDDCGCLDWHRFLEGCCAADPSVCHILNSFTGFVRAQYIFRYYNSSGSGFLAFEELSRLLLESRKRSEESQKVRMQYVTQMAQDLGDVDAVSLHVRSLNGLRCVVRASTRWIGHRVRREIAQYLNIPVEGQHLLIGTRPLEEDQTLLAVLANLPEGYEREAVDITLIQTDPDVLAFMSSNEKGPDKLLERDPRPPAPEDLRGIERLVHVTFKRFYEAMQEGHMRGTSALFRFRRGIIGNSRRHPPGLTPVGVEEKRLGGA